MKTIKTIGIIDLTLFALGSLPNAPHQAMFGLIGLSVPIICTYGLYRIIAQITQKK